MTYRQERLLYTWRSNAQLIRFGSERRHAIVWGLLITETRQFIVRFFHD